jgi:hypothetical protein
VLVVGKEDRSAGGGVLDRKDGEVGGVQAII